ncbi:helix-turn-helix domain-containing protein [Microbispora sp. RL4-1S]|uniref:Helix-turn-helix domain-containing protein n=1 Tax=Microbispora oryzae TaxID=2806554 RepID=A0A941AHC7_9ACTN|nr:helix-turn-helix transcriptional regulator [Microbispora oryzae]MBP2703946.1 helix-turn-helix domain-containing protein [Microbispora oryzae]
MDVLADLLRALRSAARPDGPPGRGDEPAAGLRQEEVALLAGINPAYYARLERGDALEPPDWVLGALGRVFGLDDGCMEYLHRVAHPGGDTQVPGRVLRIVDGWRHAPVFAVNRRLDVLAANSMARTLFKGMDHTDNLMRHTFLSDAAREFFPHWEQEARSKVAHLRAAASAGPVPALARLVDELCSESREFRRLWARSDVGAGEYKRMHHHDLGGLDLRHDTLSVESAPGVLLFVCQADPGTASEDALSLLSILAAEDE